MGIFNKLAFWKKDDDLDFDRMADHSLGDLGQPAEDGLATDNPNLSSTDSFGQEPTSQSSAFPSSTSEPAMPTAPEPMPESKVPAQQDYPLPNRELELISSKLDTIKAILTSLDQRTANLETVAGVEKQKEEHKLW
jgi:hypothetical protein